MGHNARSRRQRAVKEKKTQQVFMRKPLDLSRLATVWAKTCNKDRMRKRGVYGRLGEMKTARLGILSAIH